MYPELSTQVVWTIILTAFFVYISFELIYSFFHSVVSPQLKQKVTI